jgi:hypothetical protein
MRLRRWVGSVGGRACCEDGADEGYCGGGVVEKHYGVCIEGEEEKGKIGRVWDAILPLDGRLAMVIPTNYMATGHPSLILHVLAHGSNTRTNSSQ